MAEEQDTDEETALEEEPQETEVEEQEPEGFNKTQLQQIYSGMGRIIKQQFEKDVLPHIQKEAPEPGASTPGNAEYERFNQELLDQALGGDMIGAFQKYEKVRDRANKNMSVAKEKQLTTALTKYSDDPQYKDIYPDMEKVARSAMGNGTAPEAAAELGLAKAKVAALERKFNNGNDVELSVSPNGKAVTRTKVKALPAEYQKAMKRDIAAGVFKDEQDYRNSMSPAAKARLGM